MKRWIILLLIALFPYCTTKYKPIPWKVGQWVRYKMRMGKAESLEIRYALVGREGKRFWFEVNGKSPSTSFIFKVLVKERSLSHPKEEIIKIGDQPAYIMPKEVGTELPSEYKPPIFEQEEIHKYKIGIERIKIEKEVLHCIHSKLRKEGKEYEVWMSSKVPILGIAKLSSHLITLEIIDYGYEGAVSEIKEKPQEVKLEF